MSSAEFEPFYSTLFENSPDLLLLIDSHFSIQHVNRSVSRFLSLPVQEILGAQCHSILFGHSERCSFCPFFRENLSPQSLLSGRVVIRERHFSMNCFPLYSQNGDFIGFMDQLHDITVESQHLLQVEQQERYLKSIFKASPIGFGTVSSDFVLRFVNKKICYLTGYKEEELTNKELSFLFYSQDDYDHLRSAFVEARGSEYIFKGQFRWLRQAGQQLDVLFTMAPIDTENLEQGYTISVIDISSQLLNERTTQAVVANRLNLATLRGSLHYLYEASSGVLKFSGLTLPFLGYTVRECNELGLPGYKKLIHPEDWPTVARQLLRSLRLRQNYQMEYRLRTRSGAYIYIQDSGFLVMGVNPLAFHVHGNLINIDEKKRNQDELQSSEMRFRNVFAYAPLGIVLLEENYQIIEANPKFCGILGISPEAAPGQNFFSLVFVADSPLLKEQFVSLLQQENQFFQLEARFLLREDSIVWANLVVSYFYDSSKKQPLYLVVVEDITEKIRTEMELQQNEARLREVSRLAQLGYWNADYMTLKVSWSDEMFKIFNLDPKGYQPTVQSLFEFIHPEDLPRLQEQATRGLGKRQNFQIQLRVKILSGQVRYVHFNGYHQYDDLGNLLRSSGTVQDITAMKEHEKELVEAEEKA